MSRGLVIDEKRCLRCAACSSLAPDVFALRADAATVVAQPSTSDQTDRAMAALLVCPGQAIGMKEPA